MIPDGHLSDSLNFLHAPMLRLEVASPRSGKQDRESCPRPSFSIEPSAWLVDRLQKRNQNICNLILTGTHSKNLLIFGSDGVFFLWMMTLIITYPVINVNSPWSPKPVLYKWSSIINLKFRKFQLKNYLNNLSVERSVSGVSYRAGDRC